MDLDSNDAITDMIWKDIANVLCDKTSIGSIYSSNHTLQELCISHLTFPEEVVSLLAMNQNEDKSEVARQKILKHHFLARGNNANVFSRMPETMMPFPMEWIGRNRLGFSLMYNVVRDNPTLFDNLIGKDVMNSGPCILNGECVMLSIYLGIEICYPSVSSFDAICNLLSLL